MRTITITSKRQATLPAAVCEALGVGPGDKLVLEPRTIDGETVWVMRARKPDWSWFGAAGSLAKARTHDWDEVERSIGQAWAEDSQ